MCTASYAYCIVHAIRDFHQIHSTIKPQKAEPCSGTSASPASSGTSTTTESLFYTVTLVNSEIKAQVTFLHVAAAWHAGGKTPPSTNPRLCANPPTTCQATAHEVLHKTASPVSTHEVSHKRASPVSTHESQHPRRLTPTTADVRQRLKLAHEGLRKTASQGRCTACQGRHLLGCRHGELA